jgi:hypothetical protein
MFGRGTSSMPAMSEMWRGADGAAEMKRQPENSARTSSREGGSASGEASKRMGEWRGRGRGRGRGISAAAALAVAWAVVVGGGGGCYAHDPDGSAQSTALGATRSIRSCNCALAPTRKGQGGAAGGVGGGGALLLLRYGGVYFGGAGGKRPVRKGLRGGGGQGLVPDPSWSDEIEEEGLVKVDADEQVRVSVCFPGGFSVFLGFRVLRLLFRRIFRVFRVQGVGLRAVDLIRSSDSFRGEWGRGIVLR